MAAIRAGKRIGRANKETLVCAGELVMAEAKKYGTEIICGSDAHVDLDVGTHEYSWKLIRECEFPEERVVNTRVERFKEYMK